jgi:hypothetical protein
VPDVDKRKADQRRKQFHQEAVSVLGDGFVNVSETKLKYLQNNPVRTFTVANNSVIEIVGILRK